MKKLLIIAAIFSSASAFAQQNAIKVNYLSPIFSTINVSFEHALSENGSVQLGFFYTGASIGDTKFSGFGVTPEYRIYPGESAAPAGFYVAPFLRYQSLTLEVENNTAKATFSTMGGGLVIGKQWLFGKRVSFDIFLGPSYNSGKLKVDAGSEGDFDLGSFDGFGLRIGSTIGIAF